MEATRPVSDAGQKAAIFVTVTPEKGKPIARWGRKVTGLAQQSNARQRDRRVGKQRASLVRAGKRTSVRLPFSSIIDQL